MKENPDNNMYIGLGPTETIPDTTLESRFLVPNAGMLRFVEKEVDNYGTPSKARVLQQWQWSAKAGGFDWYDVPLVEKDDYIFHREADDN
jgi:hypothetical protein